MPEVFWPLQRLGVIDRMKHSKFVRKHSVQFVTYNGKGLRAILLPAYTILARAALRGKWNAPSSTKCLFDRASELGADCRDETRVLDILFDGDRCTGIVIRDKHGETTEIRSKVVMDGSGQQALIASKLGLKKFDENLKKAAVWSYWKRDT